MQACDGNVERAVDWLFSHADDPMEDEEPQQGAAQPAPAGGHVSTAGRAHAPACAVRRFCVVPGCAPMC
eukprot:1140235-Pelagomonas_calceolata.AAC.4